MAALAEIGVRLVTGPGDPMGAFADAELVVVSPGVPFDARPLTAVRARRVPIIGELELGWRATEADTIAITGTNGKTTTTALTGSILAQQPRPVLVAGNIGTPLAAHALTFPPDGLVVCEVSSFQLETTELFQPRVAVVLNLTPDHLDRHRTFEAYGEAKARIFANQTSADCAILNADDETTRAMASRSPAPVVWFSRRRELPHGVFVRDGRIAAKLNGHVEEICPLSEIFLRGQHNVENVLAATACALWTGVSPAAIRAAIGRFRGVAHRIEWVRDLAGVKYYNDSKGTNVDSTLRALESFSEPIVLIAGGKGKGQAWEAAGRRGARAGRPCGPHRRGRREDRCRAERRRRSGDVRPVAPGGGRAGARGRNPGQHRPPVAGLRLVRHVRQLRAPRRSLQEDRGAPRVTSRARRRLQATGTSGGLLRTVGGCGGGAALAPPHYH